MNNMQKAFKAKSGLRCMADGGIFKSMQRIGQDDVAVFTDAKNRVAGSEAYTPRAMRELPNAGITPGAVAPMPAPAKLSVAPVPVIQPAAASPLPAPAAAPAQQFRPQDPYEKATGKAPVAITPRKIPMDYMAQTGGFGPTPMPAQPGAIGAGRAEIGANRRPIGGVGAMGMPLMTSVGYASGGEVKGPGGPTDDEVGPVMLSDGEYVLPADTVEKVGKENLDALKDATHTPVSVKQRRGLRKMADGTKTEKEKRLGALGLPITTSVEYAEPVRPTPAVGALGLPITTSVGETNPIPRVGAMGLPIATSVGPDPMPRERTGALRMPITTSAGYGKPAAQPPPESAVGWQGKPRATPTPPPVVAEPGLLERLGSVPLPRDPRLLSADAPVATPVAPSTGAKAPNPASMARAASTMAPDTAEAPRESAYTADDDATPRGFSVAQSNKLEGMGVSLVDQISPVYEMKQSALPDAPQVGASATPSAFSSSGAKQINSKYYRDANGAVIEGTAPVGTAPSVAAGPKTFGDPNGAPTAWSDVPRTYRSDTIRQGVDPGVQVNLGEGIFATTNPLNGDKRLNSFSGVGSAYNENSARFGPDPNGADRARQDAMVEANLQAKPRELRGPRMPEFRSDERDINARFDKQLKAAEQRFTSPRAAGNLAKAQLQIEEARAAALNQNADNITRQQQSAMQFQSDQARNDLTERDLSQRAAQAARADETDRLGIDAQNARAAGATAQASVLADREFDRKNYEVAVKNKQFYGTYNDWAAYGGSRKQGGGQPYVSVKDIERNTKRVTDRVAQMFPEDPDAQANVVANARLFWGAPDAAVAAYAPVVNSIAQKLGRPDIGLPQLSDDGKETWDASAADLQKGSDNWWTDARASLWDGDGPAYKFVTDGGEEIFIAKSRLSAPEQRFLQSYLQSSKPKKERD